MKRFKVIYENLSGQNKCVDVVGCTKEDAKNYVLCNYPDCLQVVSVIG